MLCLFLKLSVCHQMSQIKSQQKQTRLCPTCFSCTSREICNLSEITCTNLGNLQSKILLKSILLQSKYHKHVILQLFISEITHNNDEIKTNLPFDSCTLNLSIIACLLMYHINLSHSKSNYSKSDSGTQCVVYIYMSYVILNNVALIQQLDFTCRTRKPATKSQVLKIMHSRKSHCSQKGFICYCSGFFKLVTMVSYKVPNHSGKI